MDYLITNGYPSAAKKFASEANLQPCADVEAIQERVEIRNAIYSGNVQSAIERLNELDPQVISYPCCFYIYSLAIIMIILCFMHHSYTFSGVDEKHSSSVLSMTSLYLFWNFTSITNGSSVC